MLEFVPVPEPDVKVQDEMIEKMAQKIHQYGMEVPAIFFGEAMKPVSFIGGQFIHAFSFLPSTFFLDDNAYQQFAFILDDRVKLEQLLVRLEQLARCR